MIRKLLDMILGKECPRCKGRWHFDGYECKNVGMP